RVAARLCTGRPFGPKVVPHVGEAHPSIVVLSGVAADTDPRVPLQAVALGSSEAQRHLHHAVGWIVVERGAAPLAVAAPSEAGVAGADLPVLMQGKRFGLHHHDAIYLSEITAGGAAPSPSAATS